MRTRAISILLIVVLLLPLVGCGSGAGGNTLKLGLIVPLTGDVKTYGESVKNATELAVAEWNAKGGVLGKTIVAVPADDKNDATEASAAATKLVNHDKVKFIIGAVTSSCAIPVSDIANSNQVLQISPTSTNPKLTVADGKRKPYVFRSCFIDPPQGSTMAVFSLETLQAKKAAVLYDNGNDYTKGLAEYFRAAFEKGGGTVNVYEAYSKSDTDFAALLTKVIADSPDVLYLPDYYNKINVIAKQARDKGFKGVMAGADGWDSSDLATGPVEGCYFTNHYSTEDPRPEVQAWVTAYKDKFGKEPDALGTLAYDATNLLLNAIKTAGSEDTAKVRDALQATQGFPAVTGAISFDENGDPIKDITVLQIKDGKPTFVEVIKPR